MQKIIDREEKNLLQIASMGDLWKQVHFVMVMGNHVAEESYSFQLHKTIIVPILTPNNEVINEREIIGSSLKAMAKACFVSGTCN